MQGVASAEDIDLAMKKGTHQHMGPLHLADYIGLDTCLNIMRVLHSGLGEDKYRPCPMLVQLVDAGASSATASVSITDHIVYLMHKTSCNVPIKMGFTYCCL